LAEENKTRWYSKLVTQNEQTSTFLIAVITAVLSLPLFIIVYGYVPEITLPFGDGVRIDHFLVFILVFVVVYFLVKKLRIIVYGLIIVGLVILTYTNFTGTYGLKDLYHDYSTMLYSLQANHDRTSFEEWINIQFDRGNEIVEAVDYKEEQVRNLGANYAVANFQDYEYLHRHRKMIQYFSIYKEVRRRWNYVFDPYKEDYFASVSETIEQLDYDDKFKGDCDDYSILIGGLIRSVGGEVRLVRTKVTMKDSTEVGHLYPEVKIGGVKDLEAATYIIKAELFHKESKGKSIHYYKDSDGYIWLNFDYNDHYPAGKYQSHIRESVLVL
jgi:hypothetical protein